MTQENLNPLVDAICEHLSRNLGITQHKPTRSQIDRLKPGIQSIIQKAFETAGGAD